VVLVLHRLRALSPHSPHQLEYPFLRLFLLLCLDRLGFGAVGMWGHAREQARLDFQNEAGRLPGDHRAVTLAGLGHREHEWVLRVRDGQVGAAPLFLPFRRSWQPENFS